MTVIAHDPKAAHYETADDTAWRMAPHFPAAEVRCKHSGLLPTNAVMTSRPFALLLAMLEALRDGSPLVVNSWYRHPTHPIEAAKPRPGPHCTGLAVDLAVSHQRALAVIDGAIDFARVVGFPLGVGIKQHGSPRFVHLDFAGMADGFTPHRPAIWSYE